MMTVRELIEMLEEFDGDCPVMLGVQPNYPLQYNIAGVWQDIIVEEYPDVVYILQGESGQYFTNRAWED